MKTTDFINSELNSIAKKGLLRTLYQNEGVDFSSNDYLGLSNSPEVRSRLIDALGVGIPLGSSGSRLTSGNLDFHLCAEEDLSKFVNREDALLFSSGYLANEGIISTLAKDSIIFSDELNHSSIINGIRLSKSTYHIFRHNDLNHLENLIVGCVSKQKKVIITESLFSMDGDFSPLYDLISLAEKYSCLLIVDEAHSTGVFGEFGGGLLSNLEFDKDLVVSIHTGGKALGGHGAFVACSKLMKDYLINKCDHFIYTTSISPMTCLQLSAAAEVISNNNYLRKNLLENSIYMRNALQECFEVESSNSQIIPIIIGDNSKVLSISAKLRKLGLFVVAIRSPTVKQGFERIRISMNTMHTKKQLQDFVEVLATIRSELN